MPVNSARVSGATALDRDEIAEQQLRADVGRDRARENLLAAGQHDAGRDAVRGHDLLHFDAGANLDAAARRRRSHGAGDGAHAADGVPPGAALAVHLAEAMVQQNVGGARRRRRRVIADNAVEREGTFDDVALEPAVEEIGGAAREEVE